MTPLKSQSAPIKIKRIAETQIAHVKFAHVKIALAAQHASATVAKLRKPLMRERLTNENHKYRAFTG